jgi:hypothetical protein
LKQYVYTTLCLDHIIMKEEICLLNVPHKISRFQVGDVVNMGSTVMLNSFSFCSRGVVISKTNVSRDIVNVVGFDSNLQTTIPLRTLTIIPKPNFDYLNTSVHRFDVSWFGTPDA